MTTESKQRSRVSGSLVLGAALGATGVGALVVLLGALLGGSAAAYGALVGVLLGVGVLTVGSLTVDLVAGLVPGASLLVALLTYVLQVLALALVFVALTGSGALDTTLDRHWLGGAIVVVTLAWSAVQIRLFTTARIPAFDLPAEPVDAGAR